jgi:hypothetical protein
MTCVRIARTSLPVNSQSYCSARRVSACFSLGVTSSSSSSSGSDSRSWGASSSLGLARVFFDFLENCFSNASKMEVSSTWTSGPIS